MNMEQQRIAIAEACGWTDTPIVDGKYGQTDVPDYLNDLNAMHEVEKVLTEEQRIAYSNHTYDVACKVQRETEKWRWISLTAKQRAEAFLKTIGLWEDGE
jgi:hypothetical protein